MDKVSKWFLPAVHLDDFHTIDNFTHQSDSLVCFPSSLHPQSSKLLSHPCCRICCYDNKISYFNNINILTLKRYKCDQESSSHQCTGTNLVAEDGCHNDQLQGTCPQVVVEKDSGVKPEIREKLFLLTEIFCNKANLLTSFERRFTICPMVV